MLIDDFLPRYDVVERHRTTVGAPPDAVYRALRTADLTGAPLVRALLALRTLPAAIARAGWRGIRARHRPLTLAAFEARGFTVLAEAPPRELVIGLAGRFWTPGGDLQPADAAAFRAGPRPGTAQAAWNFTVEPRSGGGALLSTETRVLCADAAARRRFRAYWFVVGPGSGVIRHLMLRAVRREAESRGAR